jgi:hypothetical protein
LRPASTETGVIDVGKRIAWDLVRAPNFGIRERPQLFHHRIDPLHVSVARVEIERDKPNVIDVLDRVLDKGIVMDAWVRVSIVGIDLITVEARVVVASIETYLNYAGAVAELLPASPPPRLASTAPRPH